jgi:hypothetical protein
MDHPQMTQITQMRNKYADVSWIAVLSMISKHVRRTYSNLMQHSDWHGIKTKGHALARL